MKKIFTLLLIFASVCNLYAGSDDIITLDLSKSLNPEVISYTTEGYWTETYNDVDYPFIDFEFFSFSHLIDGEGSSWGGMAWDGFTVSKSGDNTNYNGEYGWEYSQQWGNMAGGGIKTDENGDILKGEDGKVTVEKGIPYLVAFYSDWTMEYCLQTILAKSILTESNASYKAVGVYINTSPWPYYSNIEGDGYARAFEEGDYFKLFIHGLDENLEDNGKVVEYILAEFTDGVLIQSPDWEWIDLSGLGEVYGFYYTMETTDIGMYGTNTAMYFCLDKLQVKKSDDSGINKIKTNIAVYPNPFADYVDVNTTADGIATIYNLSGNTVLNINLKNGNNRINTSELPKGAYILKYNDETVKLIK